MSASASPVERIPSSASSVGGLPITRALPTARRRMVGAWCFADHAGPADLPVEKRMKVGPHPHTGLQTFSWMIEGEILHRDSLGSVQMLRPGQVNLMTAGRGISHSEESQTERLHLAQLWIALPETSRHCPPAFEHFPSLPILSLGGFTATLLAGSYDQARSPVPTHTPLLGMDIASPGAGSATLALDREFEHGLMVLEGSDALTLDGETYRLAPGELLYLAPGLEVAELSADAASRVLLLGGPPFPETILLWWNFVGRSSDEIAQFARDWNAESDDFGQVEGFEGPRLTAPDFTGLRLRG